MHSTHDRNLSNVEGGVITFLGYNLSVVVNLYSHDGPRPIRGYKNHDGI